MTQYYYSSNSTVATLFTNVLLPFCIKVTQSNNEAARASAACVVHMLMCWVHSKLTLTLTKHEWQNWNLYWVRLQPGPRLCTAVLKILCSLLKKSEGRDEGMLCYKLRQQFWIKSHCYIVDTTGLLYFRRLLSVFTQSSKGWAQTAILVGW